MNIDDFAGACTQTILRAPATLTADGNSAGIDCLHNKGKTLLALAALNTAGTNPTLAIKLQTSPDADVVTSVTPGANTGTGTCTQVYGGPDAVAETITVTFSNATTATVVGSVSGNLANATVGTLYQSAKVEFMLTAGGTAFALNDTFAIITTARVYADADGGAFTSLTSGASMQKLQVEADRMGRYWRVNFDIGGTVSPGYTVGIAAYSVNV